MAVICWVSPSRHGRASPGGHPRLGSKEDVDARDKAGHDRSGDKILGRLKPHHRSKRPRSATTAGALSSRSVFLVATFGWGLGFYGQSVYVAELHRLHGWPASADCDRGTTFFYLFGALLVVFISEAIPRRPAQLPAGGASSPWRRPRSRSATPPSHGNTGGGLRCSRSVGPAPVIGGSPIRSGYEFDHKRGMAIKASR